jgi:hypothetical protein
MMRIRIPILSWVELALPIVGDLLPRNIGGGIERGMGDREGYRTDRVGDSIGDPDPDPQDPHVFGPRGSGSISQRHGSGSESFPFLLKVLFGLKDCLQNKILTKNFRKNLPPQSH